MAEPQLTQVDVEHLRSFLGDAFDYYRDGIIDKTRAVDALAKVVTAVDSGDYDTARQWFEQGGMLILREDAFRTAPSETPVAAPGAGQPEPSPLMAYVRETAAQAAAQDTSGDFFNAMSWLDQELEENPGAFDRFFDRPWARLSEAEQVERMAAVRQVL